MDDLQKFFLTILVTVAIFTILTIPHIMLMCFDIGISYPLWAMLLCSLVSIVTTPFIVRSKLFRK